MFFRHFIQSAFEMLIMALTFTISIGNIFVFCLVSLILMLSVDQDMMNVSIRN